jgi:DNA-binding HxlR family transcriptional regulator
MKSHHQYCPVAKAHEILGDRWTMLIVRELIAGLERFNEIARGLPGIPRSLLVDRLRRLENAGVIELVAMGPKRRCYRLTDAGRELEAVVVAMGAWASKWAFGLPNEDELDPGLLLWWMERRLNTDALPKERTTIQFDFHADRLIQFWFVIERGEASVCLEDPGFEIGLVVTADLSIFYQVWLGHLTLRQAAASDRLRVEGMPAHERAFSTWFLWSPMAEFVSEQLAMNRA